MGCLSQGLVPVANQAKNRIQSEGRVYRADILSLLIQWILDRRSFDSCGTDVYIEHHRRIDRISNMLSIPPAVQELDIFLEDELLIAFEKKCDDVVSEFESM